MLSDHTHSELQDVEYSLWKLHYKHIDEFRKIIKKSSGNVGNKKSGMQQDGVEQRSNDNNLNSFKSFLSEAIEFYQTLIVKLRKHYGVPEEASFYIKGWISTSVEPDVMLRCEYLCHRCLVCMGDLARYKQQCENPDAQTQNWSVAAIHYLEATRIWPDSGNPQNQVKFSFKVFSCFLWPFCMRYLYRRFWSYDSNLVHLQLAVLATYIGDEFLALYHCVRSLPVKEPFPDAWNNLILLFEKVIWYLRLFSKLNFYSIYICLIFLSFFYCHLLKCLLWSCRIGHLICNMFPEKSALIS